MRGSPALIAFAALFEAAGLLLLAFAWRSHQRARRARAWPMAPGVVLESRPRPVVDASGRRSWLPYVRYAYEVGGRRHESEAVTLGGSTSYGHARARRISERYPQGATVAVRFDPDDPATACLEPRSPNAVIAAVISAACLAGGSAMAAAAAGFFR